VSLNVLLLLLLLLAMSLVSAADVVAGDCAPAAQLVPAAADT
jgi:hypothetical protein